MTESRIVFQPYGKRLKAESGKNLFEAAMEIGVNLRSICGGRGSCGKCRVIIRYGEENLSPPSEREKILLPEEHITNGMRLACQAQVKKEGTIIVEIPKESQVDQQRLLLTGLEREVNLSPAVRNVTVHVKKPSFPDAGSDIDRLVEAVESESGLKPRVDYEALKKIPNVLRNGNWTVTVTIWNDTEIVSVEPGVLGDLYGFAVDVGTTKLAGYLVDLNKGKTIATASRMNPQIAYGEDVISRIHYIAKDEKNLTKLRAAVADAINQLIKEACENAGVTPERICDMTLTGNTAMHHISLGIPPNYVALTPYPAALQSPANIKARDLTFAINRGAYVHAFPNIAGFVGGDAVADVLATGIWDTDELCMLIDIGTNTEIVLGSESRLSACSCASGPAFEGAHIEHGMRATTGAIEHVWIDPETVDVTCKTIDNQRPRGICGSGIIDITAEMLRTGVVDYSGRFNRRFKSSRVTINENSAEFVVAWQEQTAIESDIVVTQSDIREVQLAKAAIYTGATVLMNHMCVLPQQIDKIFLAGAFGNYVDPGSAKIIGMYPDVPLEHVQFVGNTAGSGARMTLLSVESRETAREIADSTEYVELGADPDFQEEFLKATYLPHKEMERFPNVTKLLENKSIDRMKRIKK